MGIQGFHDKSFAEVIERAMKETAEQMRERYPQASGADLEALNMLRKRLIDAIDAIDPRSDKKPATYVLDALDEWITERSNLALETP